MRGPSARRALPSLVAVAASAALVALAGCRGHDSVAREGTRRLTEGVRNELLGVNEPKGPDLYDYGSLARNFMVYIIGKPFLFSEEDVDRIVGDPWRMHDSTRVKLDTLPPRLRLKAYSALAGNLDTIRYEGARLGDTPAGQQPPLALRMDEQTMLIILDGQVKAIEGYFRTEEIIDLIFYGLSRQAFFPRSQEGWKDLKGRLPQYDLALGLVGLASMAMVDEGNIDLGGWVAKTETDSFRIGWYASGKRMGFQWHPHFKVGVQGATPGFDVSLGWVEYFRARDPSEVRSIELVVREHLLTGLSRLLNMETAATAGLRFVWVHTNPADDRTFRGEVGFYARRPALLEEPEADLLIQGALATDFRHVHASDVSVGLEFPRLAMAGAIRFQSLTDPALPTEWSVAAVFGGTVGEVPEADYYRLLELAGQQVRDAVRRLRELDARFCEMAEPTPLVETWVGEAEQELERAARRYQRNRRRTLAAQVRREGPRTVEEARAAETLPGPLSQEELAEVHALVERVQPHCAP